MITLTTCIVVLAVTVMGQVLCNCGNPKWVESTFIFYSVAGHFPIDQPASS